MKQINKYQFDRCFDGFQKKDVKLAQMTEQALADVKAEAYQQGFSEGQAAAQQSLEASLQQLLNGIGAELHQMFSAKMLAEEEARQEAAEVALTVARKLAPELMSQQPVTEIEALLAECLAEQRSEPRLVIRVSETVMEALEGRIETLASEAHFGGKVILMPEPGIAEADCKIEWADGGAARDQGRIEAAIDQAINRYLGGKLGLRNAETDKIETPNLS